MAVAVVGFYFLKGDFAFPAKAKKSNASKIAEVLPAKAQQVIESVTNSVQSVKSSGNAVAVGVETPTNEVRRQTSTNGAFVVRRTKKRIFKSGLEQALSFIVSTVPGDMPPPMPIVNVKDEQTLLDILIGKNVPEEGDDALALEKKANVDAAKKDLRDYIKQGGNVQDFLSYYHKKLVEMYHKNKLATREVNKLARSGADRELVVAYCREVNKKLAEEGIKKVRLSPDVREEFNIKEDEL